jgi:hypothetical protein
MKSPRSWGKKAGRKPSIMWELTVDDLKSAWAPASIPIEEGESLVALAVATAFLEDNPHILRAQDITIPTSTGDQDRALTCFLWLAKTAAPMWLSSWICRTEPYQTRELKEQIEQLEGEDTVTNEQLGNILMDLRFRLPEADLVHRRSMHKAQRMGVRAAYQGAILHTDHQIRMLALLAANLVVFAIPDVEFFKNELLLTEATQSSALIMLDKLLLEKNDA